MKLKTTHAMALCALTLLATQPVWADPGKAGNSIDMIVEGVLKPSSCHIKIDGEVQFAPMNKKAIKPDTDGTDLGKPAVVPLEINCGQTESTVGVGFSDNFVDSPDKLSRSARRILSHRF